MKEIASGTVVAPKTAATGQRLLTMKTTVVTAVTTQVRTAATPNGRNAPPSRKPRWHTPAGCSTDREIENQIPARAKLPTATAMPTQRAVGHGVPETATPSARGQHVGHGSPTLIERPAAHSAPRSEHGRTVTI